MKEFLIDEKLPKSPEINNIECHTKQLSNITEDMRLDILSGMRQKDFIKKYSVSRQTFLNYKKLLIPDYEQTYNLKTDRKAFHKFVKTHNKYECMLRFNVTERTFFNALKYDREHFDELEEQ